MTALSFALLGHLAAARALAGTLAALPSAGIARGSVVVGPLSFAPGAQQTWQQVFAPPAGETRRLAVISAASLYGDSSGSSPLQLGVGAAGAETPVACLDRRGVNDPYVPEIPIVVPAGQRIAVRFRDSWSTGTNVIQLSLAYLVDSP